MRGNWRLLVSVVVGTVVAGAILAATAIYADAIRDLGLAHALERPPVHDLDVRVSQTNIAIRAPLYEQSRARIDRALDASLGEARGAAVRQGTTATFYPAAPGAAPDLDNEARPRANLRFRTDLLQHTTLTAGRLPSPTGTADGAVEVLLGATTAEANGLGVDDRLELHTSWAVDVPPLAVVIVGLIEANDLASHYWGGRADLLDSQTMHWATYVLFVSEESFFGTPARAIPSMTARYLDVYQVERERLDSRGAAPVAAAVASLEGRLGATENLVRVNTQLGGVLETFDEQLFFVRIPLFVLLLQIGGVVAYYLLVVSTMLMERPGRGDRDAAQSRLDHRTAARAVRVRGRTPRPARRRRRAATRGAVDCRARPHAGLLRPLRRRAPGRAPVAALVRAGGCWGADRLLRLHGPGVAGDAADGGRLQAQRGKAAPGAALPALLP